MIQMMKKSDNKPEPTIPEFLNQLVQEISSERGSISTEEKIRMLRNMYIGANASATGSKTDHPNHYTFGKFEVIDVIQDWKLGYELGNVVKYVARAGKKKKGNPLDDKLKEIEDLQKAVVYLQFRITQAKLEYEQLNND